MHGWMDAVCTDAWMHRITDGKVEERHLMESFQVDRWTGVWIDGQTDKRTDGWVDERGRILTECDTGRYSYRVNSYKVAFPVPSAGVLFGWIAGNGSRAGGSSILTAKVWFYGRATLPGHVPPG